MVLSIYSLFKVDIRNLVRSKLSLAKNFNISPYDVSNMVYWEYEMIVKEAIAINEEERKQHDEQQGSFDANHYAKDMMRNARSSIKIPKI